MKSLGCSLSLVVLSVGSAANATIITTPWVPAFKGVDYTTGQADTNEVHQQKVYAFRVDLREPSVQFFSTPSNGSGSLDTYGQTTTTFVNTYGVSLGINANFFSPVTSIPNDPRDLVSLAISDGEVVSPYETARPIALLLTRSNQASIITADLTNYANYWTAVAGSDRVLINGVAQKASCTNDFCSVNPRSAAGISEDNRYLILMVIDGRQPGWSDGATLYETGQWLLRLGAWKGLNLDGGGSSALAKMQSGAAVLLNKPSDGTQRVDGNHLGVFASALAPVILAQPQSANSGLGQSATFFVNSGGTTPLRYQWRLNGTNIASATTSTYTRTNAQATQFGYYTVVITNGTGAVTSASALLLCTNAPTSLSFGARLNFSNGTVQLPFTADPGRAYTLETSSNLLQWLAVTNFFNPQPSGVCLHTHPGTWPQRYYRLRWQAP